MPETSGSIGTRRDLKVRLGDTLRPQVLTLRIKAGILNPEGATVRADLYQSEADMKALSVPTWEVVALPPSTAGEPRYRLGLAKEKVAQLANLAKPRTTTSAPAARGQAIRTVYWTCSWEDANGIRIPLYYGQIVIYLGATGG